MSNAVFPSLAKGLTFTVLRSVKNSTNETKALSAARVASPNYQNPIHAWELEYGYLYDNTPSGNNSMPYAPYTDVRTMLGFVMARNNDADDFLFVDPDDNLVGPAITSNGANTTPASSGTPSTIAELQVVNDGAGNYYSPIQRNMGGLFPEDITDLNSSGLYGGAAQAVYANGTKMVLGTDYSIAGPGLAIPGFSSAGLYIIWTPGGSPGAPASPVTAQFSFYFRVHFSESTEDFEKWLGTVWAIGGTQAKKGKGYLAFETHREPLA